MIAVIQRVSGSEVRVGGKTVGKIGKGLNILLGVVKGDTEGDAEKLSEKIANLRIFEDERGKFHFSLKDVGGSALVVSQFTLCANLKKGRRPSFEQAEDPAKAKILYEKFCELLEGQGLRVERGVFGAMMEVHIINWGPVTFILDSREL